MMNDRPHFELTRVFSDKSSEIPEIVPLCDLPCDTNMERRHFLGAALAITSAFTLMNGCSTRKPTDTITYNQYDEITGRTVSYTQPCGSSIPPNATCTCNCVSAPAPVSSPSPSYGTGRTICTCNKVCTCVPVYRSDKSEKDTIGAIEPSSILQKLSELPIQSWNYKGDSPSARHIGPMAQNFVIAFGVGDDDRHIWSVDAHGVAFAAIQALHQMIVAKNEECNALTIEFEKLELQNNSLIARIENLEQELTAQAS